jgi:hypothetical protein
MSDSKEKRWKYMSARHRLRITRSGLSDEKVGKVSPLTRIEAAWKLLDRAQADVALFYHSHQPMGLVMTSSCSKPEAAATLPSTLVCEPSFGNLVITSDALQILLAEGSQAWDGPVAAPCSLPATRRQSLPRARD